MDRFAIVSAIMFAAGLLGGWAAYLAAPSQTPDGAAIEKDLKRHLVLGLVRRLRH